MKNRTCVIVLGMHRSGTSALMGALSMLGLDLGKEMMWPTEGNPKGYFENQRVRLVNDEIFRRLGASWDHPFPLEDEWWHDPALRPCAERIECLLEEEFDSGRPFGIKDPRMSLLYPFWAPLLRRISDRVVFILPVRNPVESVRSLCKREGVHEEQARLLWLDYMLHAEWYSRSGKRCFVHFDDLLAGAGNAVRRVFHALDLVLPRTCEEAGAEIEAFIEPAMKHQRASLPAVVEDCLEYQMIECFGLLCKGSDRVGGLPEESLLRLDEQRNSLNGLKRAFIPAKVREVLRSAAERAD